MAFQSKNTTTYTAQGHGSAALTWAQANFTWAGSNPAVWRDIFIYTPQSKNSTAYTAQTKNV